MSVSLASVVFSALTDHLTAYPTVTAVGAGMDALTIGFNGQMEAVPPGYTFRSILVSGQGMNDTMHAWGDALLLTGGKRRTGLQDDFATSFLSWWNDNGSYYSYHTEDGKDYEDTIKDELAYVASVGLPVRSVQFDRYLPSWRTPRAGRVVGNS